MKVKSWGEPVRTKRKHICSKCRHMILPNQWIQYGITDKPKGVFIYRHENCKNPSVLSRNYH